MAYGRVDYTGLSEKLDMGVQIRLYHSFHLGDTAIKTKRRPKPSFIMSKNTKVGSLCTKGKNKDWTGNILTFFAAVALFCIKKEDVVYKKQTKSQDTHLSSCIHTDIIDFPESRKECLEEVFDTKFDFKKYMQACKQLDYVLCDIDSAIDVYKMQGDEALFHIICNVFTKTPTSNRFSCLLLPGCEMKWVPEVSEFASGTTFPVVVSPFSKELRWQERNNGFFLETCIDGEWYVLDCAQINWFTLYNESTTARKKFWAAGGEVVPYLVCYDWSEIVKAVGYFGRDVLVRDYRTDLLNGYWFKFGPKAKVGLRKKGNRFVGKQDTAVKQIYSQPLMGRSDGYYITTLDRKECRTARRKAEVPFTGSELNDLFELSNRCEELL